MVRLTPLRQVSRATDAAGQLAAADERFFIDSPCPASPPTADAGDDQIVECSGPGGTAVTLDGSASSDPDGDPLSYEWRDGDDNVVGTEAVVEVVLPLGTFAFTLTVDDGNGGVDSDSVEITVEDTTPPEVTASLIPEAGGDDDDSDSDSDDDGDDEVDLVVSFACRDFCDAALTVTAELQVPGCAAVSVVDGQVVEFEIEDDECEIEVEDGVLEIEGPSLTLVVTCTDASGNVTTVEAVPPAPASGDDRFERKAPPRRLGRGVLPSGI